MRRGAKPAKDKVEAKLPVRKSPKNDGARGRDVEKRLAEALQREEQALKREAEAQEQQAATAEILQAMRRSPADTQPVFDAIVSAAARLLRADGGILTRVAGELIELAAFTMDVVLERVRRRGDLFEGVLKTKQSLSKALAALR